MDLKKTVLSLSEIERATLKGLTEEKKSFEEIVNQTNIHEDSVRRSLQWLVQKELASIYTNKKTSFEIIKDELPERKMLNSLEDTQTIGDLKKKTSIDEKEFGFCLGKLKKMNIINMTGGQVNLTEVGKEFQQEKLQEEEVIEQINEEDFDKKNLNENQSLLLKELVQRGIVKEKESTQIDALTTALGEEAKKMLEETSTREYNIFDPVPQIFPGKKHPYAKFIEEIKRKLSELGFMEMPEQLITQEFYNFDVLFQPQNHPARTWTDTYRLKKPGFGKLPEKKKVDAIKSAHENGGKSNSRGWGYKWSEEIASRLMPNAHGTSADARQMVQGVQTPAKYFVINRCYRPDVLDATHLVEFNQLDGFIVGNDLNFPKLLGILKDFAQEIAGATEVKFFPDYYPFTEPSVQLSAKHPQLGWIEFAGAGIFRPEITENLGIKEPVIAWGMGIDRLAMFKLGINDIRHLFSEDLDWLRKTKTHKQ